MYTLYIHIYYYNNQMLKKLFAKLILTLG